MPQRNQPDSENLETLQQRIADLELRLQEADETLDAIRNGDVDAVVVGGPDRQAIYTLESADRPYRLLIEQMQEGAVTLAADGTVVFCNQCFALTVGQPMEQIIGKPIQRFIPPASQAAFARLIDESANGGSKDELPLVNAKGDKVPALFSFADLPRHADTSARLIGGVITNLSEQRTLEEQLRQSQKLETIGQLTGSVAHDFNNLLMAVIGNLDLLAKRMPDDRAKRLIAGAMEGAKRGAALTQRLLAFARRQDLQTEAVDVAALLHGIRDLLTRSVGPLMQIRMEMAEKLKPAKVDANQLELAVLNLTVNARDAMPDGGILTIKLDGAAIGADGVAGLAPGDYLRLSIVDSGVGMDAETLRRAIDPFFSTKEIGKGTGLGLSMVHGFAKQLGGALNLISAAGQGTTAELWLPVSSAPVRVTPEVPTQALRPTGRAKILVVDDDTLIAMSTVAMLEDLGHQGVEAGSGAAALDMLRSVNDIDLLMTDHAMPGMTGVDLALAARKMRPDLPILLATGYGELPGRTAAGLPRISKPYQQAELSTAIARLLAPG